MEQGGIATNCGEGREGWRWRWVRARGPRGVLGVGVARCTKCSGDLSDAEFSSVLAFYARGWYGAGASYSYHHL
nr:unnamed protein product [Digitaria exilis]